MNKFGKQGRHKSAKGKKSMPFLEDIEFENEKSARYYEDLNRVENIILSAKRELTMREIRQIFEANFKTPSLFLGDVLDELVFEKVIAENRRNVQRTLYSAPADAPKEKKAKHHHFGNMVVTKDKYVPWRNPKKTVTPDYGVKK